MASSICFSEAEGSVRCFCHLIQNAEELIGLALEKTVCGEAWDRGYCTSELVSGAADGCAKGQIVADELRRYGKDETGTGLWAVGGEKVREGQTTEGDRRYRLL